MTLKHAILVVGGAGYIGAHMVRALRRAGRSVVVLDDLSRGHREMIGDTPFVHGDLGDNSLLDGIFRARKFAAVMHFAAWSLVGESVEKPLDYYRNNVARPGGTRCRFHQGAPRAWLEAGIRGSPVNHRNGLGLASPRVGRPSGRQRATSG